MNDSEASPSRAQPFYCPYCGEQDFVPVDQPGQFYCESCNRRFEVKMLGLGK
ncbi:MAG TPA: Insertion element protein [Actinomycetota bacterium]|nr:Insertion element protein [Actinomycetota bacterium]